jgi:SAM-dependent methyltransferase
VPESDSSAQSAAPSADDASNHSIAGLGCLYLVDPAASMLAIAERRLSSRTAAAPGTEPAEPIENVSQRMQFHCMTLEEFVASAAGSACLGRLDLVVSSASMHLLDEGSVLPLVAALLRPGGVFAYNLWYHSWEEMRGYFSRNPIELERMEAWKTIVNDCATERGMARPFPSADAPRLMEAPLCERSPSSIMSVAQRYGLRLHSIQLDFDRVSPAFLLAFSAMSPHWLAALGGLRPVIIQQAAHRCRALPDCLMPTVRIMLCKQAQLPATDALHNGGKTK